MTLAYSDPYSMHELITALASIERVYASMQRRDIENEASSEEEE